MAENSKIEWCDHTFNPWVGCTKVSAACDHCYAETWAKRSGLVKWGNAPRRRTSEANWAKPFRWNRAAQAAGAPATVFCASLADWLDNRAPHTWRLDLAQMIESTPHLIWLLLTKRPQNWEQYSPWPYAPPNVWLGTTAENQKEFDRRWPYIANVQAAVHFVSYEPALGPLSLAGCYPVPDWIICGGESGHHARDMDPAWARTLRDECRTAGAAFFMKQMTRKQPIPPDLMVREIPTSEERDDG